MLRAAVLALALGAAGASQHADFMEYIDSTRGGKRSTKHMATERTTYPSRRHADLEAAAKDAAAVSGTEAPKMIVEKPAMKPQPRRLQADCPDQFYVIGTETDTRFGDHVGAYDNAAPIIPGCPWTLEIAAGQALYLNLPGMNETNQYGSLPMLLWSWSVIADNGETPLNMFSLRGKPAYRENSASTFYDWYYWPLLLEDAVTFREDNTGNMEDYYHCYSYCAYTTASCGICGSTDLRTIYDSLWITTSTYVTSETITVTNVADLVYSNKYILPDELNVIKQMYATMCAPYQAPNDWSWEDYTVLESDAVGEKDTRNKPYCDWWFNATVAKVNALGTLDCLLIPGVLCDEDGHVSDMIIDTKGLRGPLPASFDTFSHLQYIELQNNRIEGTLPSHIFDSPNLKRVDLYGNLFTGTIPCPAGVENQLIELTLANNELEGIVPDCLFTNMPEMTVFDMSRNLFDTPVPSTVSMASKLTAFYMQHAGVRGSMESLHDLGAIGNMDLSHNFLTGEISQYFIDGMPRLYRIDLSWNQLTGSLPVMGESSDFLRRIHLDHNELSGTITDQFTTFAANQDRGVLSELFLGANGFCGDLPEIFYTLLMDSHYFIYYFDVSQNHFRCSKEGNNMYWPSWAMGITEDFGMCIPIPVITAIESDTAVVDPGAMMSQTVYLQGEFTPTTDGKCKFMYADGTMAEVPAVFESTMRVSCVVPYDAPAGLAEVTVAHYCADYASAETLNDYVAVTVNIVYGGLTGGSSSKKKTKTDMGVIIGSVVAAVVALLFLVFIFFMCCRERAGKPLFKPLKDTENPLYLDDKGAEADAKDDK